MAFDPDKEALRIFRDPAIPPQEKRSLLAQLESGGPRLSDLRVAGEGGGDLVMPDKPADWVAGNQAVLDSNAAIQDDASRQQAAADAERRVQDAPPQEHGNWLLGRAEAAPMGPPPPEAPLVEENAPAPAQPQGPDAGQYRSSLNRGAMMLGQGGAPAKPQERIREEIQVQQGSLSPDQSAAITQEAEARDEATMAKERAAAGMAMQAEQTRFAAEEQALRERNELAELNARKVAEAQRLRKRQDQISLEIANADIKQPHLWSRDSFGENLLTLLSVGLFALGSKNGSGAKNVEALANREVDRQARWLAAKRGQADAIGTVLERHYANFGDVEAAKKQAVVDILGKAELEVRRQAIEAEKNGIGTVIPRLREQEQALKVARMEAEAERDKRLGAVITTSAAREMVRDRTKALQPVQVTPQGQPVPTAAPGKPPMSAADRQTAAELDQMNAGIQAGLRGEKLPPPRPSAPAAGRSPAPAKAPNSALETAFTLQRQGKSDEAIAALPPNYRQALRALYKARKADMGPGTTDADAMDAAFQDLGMPGPESAQLVPQAARERMVTLGTGERLFAPSKEIAKEIQGKVARLDGTVGGLSKMLALSRKYKGSGAVPPAAKSEIEQLGNALMFELSLAQEQGTVREAELPLYEKMVGSAIANYFKDPRYDLEAGLREVRRVFAATRNRLIGNLSPSWTGEGGPQRAREAR